MKYIAIEGVIGAGKTTLATMLAKNLDGELLLEEFEDNPFLADFYKEPSRYAFQTQMFFLHSRYRQQKEIEKFDLVQKPIVSDYTFQKDEIFAKLTLPSTEFVLYKRIADALSPTLRHPDLIVYLQNDIDRLMQNIDRRGRSYEKNMPREYIQDLHEAYNRFFVENSDIPALIINASDLDFVKNPVDFAAIQSKIFDLVRNPTSITL